MKWLLISSFMLVCSAGSVSSNEDQKLYPVFVPVIHQTRSKRWAASDQKVVNCKPCRCKLLGSRELDDEILEEPLLSVNCSSELEASFFPVQEVSKLAVSSSGVKVELDLSNNPEYFNKPAGDPNLRKLCQSLVNVSSLKLVSNGLTVMPSDIEGCLNNLKSLDLTNNELNQPLPNELMKRLENLEELLGLSVEGYVDDFTFSPLSQLKTLELQLKSSVYSGSVLGGLRNLNRLRLQLDNARVLRNRPFDVVGGNAAGNTPLRHLYFGAPKLRLLQEDIWQDLIKLHSLEFNLPLMFSMKIPKEIGLRMSQLKVLSLSGIRRLDRSFLQGLSALTSLKLADIQNVQNLEWPKLKSLTSLTIERSRLREMNPDWSKNFPGLTSLSLRGNELENLQIHMTKIRTLDLSENRLYSLSSDTFKTLKNVLTVLDLSFNELIFERGFFSDFERLTKLSLRGNALHSVDGIFVNLPMLLTLDLSSNMLENIGSDLFMATPRLKHLDLSENLFETLPSALMMSNLKTLDISSSHINDIDGGSICKMSQLKEISLKNLPLNCALCSVRDLSTCVRDINISGSCLDKELNRKQPLADLQMCRKPTETTTVPTTLANVNPSTTALKQGTTRSASTNTETTKIPFERKSYVETNESTTKGNLEITTTNTETPLTTSSTAANADAGIKTTVANSDITRSDSTNTETTKITFERKSYVETNESTTKGNLEITTTNTETPLTTSSTAANADAGIKTTVANSDITRSDSTNTETTKITFERKSYVETNESTTKGNLEITNTNTETPLTTSSPAANADAGIKTTEANSETNRSASTNTESTTGTFEQKTSVESTTKGNLEITTTNTETPLTTSSTAANTDAGIKTSVANSEETENTFTVSSRPTTEEQGLPNSTSEVDLRYSTTVTPFVHNIEENRRNTPPDNSNTKQVQVGTGNNIDLDDENSQLDQSDKGLSPGPRPSKLGTENMVDEYAEEENRQKNAKPISADKGLSPGPRPSKLGTENMVDEYAEEENRQKNAKPIKANSLAMGRIMKQKLGGENAGEKSLWTVSLTTGLLVVLLVLVFGALISAAAAYRRKRSQRFVTKNEEYGRNRERTEEEIAL